MKEDLRIRDIDPQAPGEISLVAARMRQTLIEVLGEEKGTALYSMDWLVERVAWHLDATKTTARIFLVEDSAGRILAHAIARTDRDENGREFGYFSTNFVEPGSRKRGVAASLLRQVESWHREMGMPFMVYNTAENHSRLIRLFERESEMVRLVKRLG